MLLLLLSSSWLLVHLGGCTWVDQAEYNDRIDIDGDGIEGLIGNTPAAPTVRHSYGWGEGSDWDVQSALATFASTCWRIQIQASDG